jgi:H+/Cl- antiporter ClcA
MIIETQHKWTGALLVLFAISILLAAIFFSVAYGRVINTEQYRNGQTNLNNARNALLWAMITSYVSAGIAVVLAILYFGHVTWGVNSEIPHLILFILLFAMIIVAIVAGFIAWSNVRNKEVTDNDNSQGLILAGIIALFVGLVALVISGVWRATYRSTLGASLVPAPPQSEVTITSPSSVTSVATTSGYAAPVMSMPSAPASQAPEVAFPYSV